GDQEDHGAAHPDLGGGVLQAPEVDADRHRALGADHDQDDRDREHGERSQQEDGGADAALAGEEDRQEDDRAEVGDRPGGDHQLTEPGGDLPGILEDRD